MTTDAKPKRGKLTQQARKHVAGVIREFVRSNPTARRQEITDHLNEMKIKPANGSAWTPQELSSFLTTCPIRFRSSTNKKTSGGDRVSVAEIVLASNLGAADKEQVLRSLFSNN